MKKINISEINFKYDEKRFKLSKHEKVTHIYGLFDIRNPTDIRYVGKADCLLSRLGDHLYEANKKIRNSNKYVHQHYRCKWIRKVLEENSNIDIVLIAWIPKGAWRSFEIAYIEAFRKAGYDLTNEGPGGQGGKMSEEVYKRVSKSLKKFYNEHPGINKGENYKGPRSRPDFIGENNPNYGNGAKISGDKNPMKRPEIANQFKGKNNWMTHNGYLFGGENHPFFGINFIWINNGIRNKRLDPTKDIPKGWVKGMIISKK